MRYTFFHCAPLDAERRLLAFAEETKGSPESKPRTYEEVVAAERSKRLERTGEMMRLIAAIDSDGRVMECFQRIMDDDAVKEQEVREFRSLILGRMRDAAAQLTQGKVDIEEVIRDRLQYFPVDYEDMYEIGVRARILDREAIAAIIRRANRGGGARWSERVEEAWKLDERLRVVCREISAENPHREELVRERQELLRKLHTYPQKVHEAIRTRHAELVRSGGFDLHKAMKSDSPPRAPDKSTGPEGKPGAKPGAADRKGALWDFLGKLFGGEPPEKSDDPKEKPPEKKAPDGRGAKSPEKKSSSGRRAKSPEKKRAAGGPGAKSPEKGPGAGADKKAPEKKAPGGGKLDKPKPGPGSGPKLPEKKSPAKTEKVEPPNPPPEKKEEGPQGLVLTLRVGGTNVPFNIQTMRIEGTATPEAEATAEALRRALPTLLEAVIIGEHVRQNQPVPPDAGRKLGDAIRLLGQPELQNVYVGGMKLLDIFLAVQRALERGSKPPR